MHLKSRAPPTRSTVFSFHFPRGIKPYWFVLERKLYIFKVLQHILIIVIVIVIVIIIIIITIIIITIIIMDR